MDNLERIKQLKDEIAAAEIAELEKQLKNKKNNVQESVAEPITNPTQPPQDKPVFYGDIPRKTAAMEIVQKLETTKIYLIAAIVTPFLVLIGNTFSMIVGAVVAAAAIIPTALYLNTVVKEIAWLRSQYKIV